MEGAKAANRVTWKPVKPSRAWCRAWCRNAGAVRGAVMPNPSPCVVRRAWCRNAQPLTMRGAVRGRAEVQRRVCELINNSEESAFLQTVFTSFARKNVSGSRQKKCPQVLAIHS